MRRTTDDFYFIVKTDPSPKAEKHLRSASTGAIFGGVIGGAVGYLFTKNTMNRYECKLDYFNGKYEIVSEIKPSKQN